MGEIANAMVNWDCCQMCGVPFDDEWDGFPRSCEDCE